MSKPLHRAVRTALGDIIFKDASLDIINNYLSRNTLSCLVWSAGYKQWRSETGKLYREGKAK